VAKAKEKETVTKKDIVRTISETLGQTQTLTKDMVQETLNAIEAVLLEQGRIELRNFGVFEIKRRAPRKARNPLTSESVAVGERFVVTFKPGKTMAKKVQQAHSKKRKKRT